MIVGSSSPSSFDVRDNLGMICMIVAMLLLPVGDTFTKMLTGTMNPVGVGMWRLLSQCLFLVPVAFLMRHRLHGNMFSPVVALSGVLLVGSLTALISSFAAMPIATVIAIFFVEPLILTVLAGPLLGDWAGPRRIAAVIIGLAGAMLVIRPSFVAYGWVTILPLLSALIYALNMILLKKATATRSALTVQCGAVLYAAGILTTIVGGLHLSGMSGFVPPPSEGWAWGIILCAGAVAAISFVFVAEAFRAADATALAPFQYFEILSATALGFFVFGDFPDALTWIGIAIILGSGIYIFHREGVQDTAAPRHRRGGR